MDSLANIQRGKTKTSVTDFQETAFLFGLALLLSSLFYIFTLLLHRWFQNRKKTKAKVLFDPPPPYFEEEHPPTYRQAIKIEMESNINCLHTVQVIESNPSLSSSLGSQSSGGSISSKLTCYA